MQKQETKTEKDTKTNRITTKKDRTSTITNTTITAMANKVSPV